MAGAEDSAGNGGPIKVFYSYSHKDEWYREQLGAHLSPLRRIKLIEDWHDRKIRAGQDWAKEIARELDAAGLVLLLVSADFINSEYCFGLEMTRANERRAAGEAIVIPIIIRDCFWTVVPEIATPQVTPKDGEAVDSWPKIDEAFRCVAEAIYTALKDWTPVGAPIGPSPIPPEPIPPGGPPAPPVSAPGTLADIPQAPWNVVARNRHFTGRDAVMVDLWQRLASGGPVVLTGLGGVGKTAVAVEFAHQHRDDYTLVWWINAAERSKAIADLIDLARALGLPEAEEADQRVVVAAVIQHLQRQRDWLLVFDNADAPSAIIDLLVDKESGQILITSRHGEWNAPVRACALPPWSRGESVAFLHARSGDADTEAAERVAAALADLPLALDQAASYADQAGVPLADYARKLRDAPLVDPGLGLTEKERRLGATWDVSFRKVAADSPAAAALLDLCAFFAPDDIPLDVIRDHADHLPEPLRTAAQDPAAFNEAVAPLVRYSLARRDGDSLFVHRLVQAVTRERMPQDRRREYAAATTVVIDAALPGFSYNTFDAGVAAVYDRLQPHASVAADHADQTQVAAQQAGRLFIQFGGYRWMRADHAAARTAFQRALAIAEKVFGPDHPHFATAVNNLGVSLRDLGDVQGARAAIERALAIDEKALGPLHPNVARDVNNLGTVLKDLGDLHGARAASERALAIDEATFGPDHPDVASDVNSLGLVLLDLGDLHSARAAFQRALAIDETVFGSYHPNVARDISNLGLVLRDMGDLQGARAAFERALKIWESAFGGPEHPQIAIGINNLGGVLRDVGDLHGARAAYQRALGILESTLGTQHPKTRLVRKKLESLGDPPAS